MSAPFKPGDRVKMTAEAQKSFNRRHGSDRATIIRVWRDREGIRIQRDGVKNRETYWWGFWEPEGR